MEYGIEHESTAVMKYEASSATTARLRECGLFVDFEHGQLAASPDRIADINGEHILTLQQLDHVK